LQISVTLNPTQSRIWSGVQTLFDNNARYKFSV